MKFNNQNAKETKMQLWNSTKTIKIDNPIS